MKNKLAILLAATVLSTPVMAKEQCYIKQITNTEQSGKIESVKDIERFVTAWTDDKRKCNVEFNALVKGKWHKGFGAYAFGNDESENEACTKAFHQGKRTLIQELFPQSLQSEEVLVCSDDDRPERRTGLEGLTPNPTKENFWYRGANCGWFFQTVQEQYGLYQWNIVACELQPGEWKIVDKF